MQTPHITVGIVLYKKTHYLEKCIGSLLAQSFADFELLLLDHDAELEATKYLQEKFPQYLQDERVKIISGTGNHSQGHNRLMQMTQGEIYICGSGDMTYAEDFLEQIAEEMKQSPQVRFAGVKLLRWDFDKNILTHVIDSVGVGATPWQRFFDIGQGKYEEEQYKDNRYNFGASGALMIFRKSLLTELGAEVFDNDLHYKNDVDLNYRMQWYGEACFYIAKAVAWHDRQLHEQKRTSSNAKQRIDSYFGQMAVLTKNFSPEFSLLTRLKKRLREWAIWFYIRIFERELIEAEKKFALQRQKFIEKSKKLVRNVTAHEIEQYFTND